jgi:hypothetical protein
MARQILDVPRLFMRHDNRPWAIDWRNRSVGGDGSGGNQLVFGGFPQVIADLAMVLPYDMIGAWSALRERGRGRYNAYRLRIVDPVSWSIDRAQDWRADWQMYQAGAYVEPRPQVKALASVAAGSTSITVDERGLAAPVRLGWMSYLDWPFKVVDRSGGGASTALTVERLAVAIPANAMIDLAARVVVEPTSDLTGQAVYSGRSTARFSFSVREWITR